jgi:hypothetical protein
MAEHKGYFVLGTKVCNPVPAKDAFNTDNDVIDIWKNHFKEQLRIGFDVFVNMSFTLFVEDANIHFSGVQIDTAIVFVLFIVKSHNLASFGWGL